MKRSILALTLASLAFFGNAQAATNLVINGDFEQTTNGLGQFDYQTQAVGWSSSGYNFLFSPTTVDTTGTVGYYGPTELWGPNNGANNGLTGSPTGGNFAGADGAFWVAPITQTITGLVVGQTYELSFDWAAAQQYGYDGDTTSQWTASLGSQSFSTAVYNLPNHGFSGWMHETYTYTATATTEVLSFLATGTPNGLPPFALLDGVSLTATNSPAAVSAVPEPETLAMMLAGLAAIGTTARRCRNTRRS
jgi:hypothetical protein